MAQKNQNEYNEIGGCVDYYCGKVNWVQNQLNGKAERAEELQRAITGLSICLDDLTAERSVLDGMPFLADKWTGNNAEIYLESCQDGGELYSEYSSLKKALEVNINDMVEEKRRLDNSISFLQGLMNEFGGLFQYYSWLYESYWWD